MEIKMIVKSKRLYLFVSLAALILLFSIKVSAQPDIYECCRLAEENYPLKGNLKSNEMIGQLNKSNLNKNYLPEISLFSSASYQSDVTKIDIDMQLPGGSPDFPEMPQEQYQIGINLNQLIWDGGITSSRKSMEEISAQLENSNVRTELYSLRDKVNDSCFGALIIEKQIEQLELARADLRKQLEKINSLIRNGVLLSSNADKIKAEILKIEQKIMELEAGKSTALDVLSELTGEEFDRDSELKAPEVKLDDPAAMEKRRPEYEVFRQSEKKLEEAVNLNNSKYMPKISAFGQAFYGKPGLNMFSDEFQPFYVAGIQASWNLFSWGARGNDNEVLQLKKEMVENRKKSFTKNLDAASKKYLNDIEKIEEQIEKDEEIIDLRGKIVRETESQLQNGVVTATEYLQEFNAKTRSAVDLERRKLDLIRTKIEFLTLTGNLNKK